MLYRSARRVRVAKGLKGAKAYKNDRISCVCVVQAYTAKVNESLQLSLDDGLEFGTHSTWDMEKNLFEFIGIVKRGDENPWAIRLGCEQCGNKMRIANEISKGRIQL